MSRPPLSVLHGGALGDLALAVQFVLRAFQPVELRVCARVSLGDLSAATPPIHAVSLETLRASWLYATGDDSAPDALASTIRGRRVVSFLGGPAEPVSRRLQSLTPRELCCIDPRPQPGSVRHILEQWSERALGQMPGMRRCAYARRAAPALRFRSPSREPSSSPPADRSSRTASEAPLVVLHPGSGGVHKCWSLDGFVAFARRLSPCFERVSLLVGPAECERWSGEILSRLRQEFPVLESPSPDDLVRLLRSARLLVANDSGVAHLAALLGTPVLAIFGPTDPRIWAPIGANIQIVRGDPTQGPLWGILPADVAARSEQLAACGSADPDSG